jgi:hypothetical protein
VPFFGMTSGREWQAVNCRMGGVRKHGIALVGPVRKKRPCQSRKSNVFDRVAFTVDWERQQAEYPQGKPFAAARSGMSVPNANRTPELPGPAGHPTACRMAHCRETLTCKIPDSVRYSIMGHGDRGMRARAAGNRESPAQNQAVGSRELDVEVGGPAHDRSFRGGRSVAGTGRRR